MPRVIRYHHKHIAVTFLVLFFFGGRPAEFGQEKVFFQGYLIQKPAIRVALGVNLEDIHVHASSGMKIYLANDSYKLIAEDASEARIKAQKEKLTEKFVVQAGQSRRRKDADEMAKSLKEKIDNRVYVAEDRRNDVEGVYQVRVGDFMTRAEALAFVRKLTAIGISDAWILREEVDEPASKPRWVLLNDQLTNIGAGSAVYLIPAGPESYLTFGGKSYRGIFVIRGSSRGTVLINVLNVEDYLKGVVPGELSPTIYGEIEALKAQAIAARTFALKNLGQNEGLGFDLYDTAVSQVYGGLSLEHPLSTRAVEETRGRVAVYGGQLINALYMSTCGGATEDVEKIFEGTSAPYLKSVECTLENDGAWPLKTSVVLPPLFVQGTNVSSRVATLAALGVLPNEWTAAGAKEPISAAELAEWVRQTAALVGIKAEQPFPPGEAIHFASYARYLVESFRWSERAQNLVGRSEAVRAVRDLEGLGKDESTAMAYFIVSGLFPPVPELAVWNRSLNRAEAAFYLAKAISTYRDFAHQGYVKGFSRNTLDVIEDEKPKKLEIAPNPFLLRSFDDAVSFLPAVELAAGDVVRWIESGEKVRFLQVISAPISSVLDNPSQYAHWHVRISRDDLQAKLNQFYPVGRLVDLLPRKRGASKRVIELAIVGQAGQFKATGMKIRQVLNLRDNLFVIDRELDEEGHVTHFVFSGKGWGHGVGLCQVGAYRMAQKGVGYEEILMKYYRGIKLASWY